MHGTISPTPQVVQRHKQRGAEAALVASVWRELPSLGPNRQGAAWRWCWLCTMILGLDPLRERHRALAPLRQSMAAMLWNARRIR